MRKATNAELEGPIGLIVALALLAHLHAHGPGVHVCIFRPSFASCSNQDYGQSDGGIKGDGRGASRFAFFTIFFFFLFFNFKKEKVKVCILYLVQEFGIHMEVSHFVG